MVICLLFKPYLLEIAARYSRLSQKKEIHEKVNIDDLLKEISQITAKGDKNKQKLNPKLESRWKENETVPVIENPYILPEDIEYEFVNVYVSKCLFNVCFV